MRKLTRWALLLLSAVTLFVHTVAAAYQREDGIEFQNDPSALTVLFVNGIKNDENEVIASSENLIKSLYAQGLPSGKYNLYYIHNPTEGALDDTGEVAQQVKISNTYLQLAGGNKETYYRLLGSYYNQQSADTANLPAMLRRIVEFSALLSKRMKMSLDVSPGVVVVPHSQGNLYVEAAYAMLFAEGRTDLTAKIRVVGVAPASATTPSDRYITSGQDEVINIDLPILALILDPETSFAQLPANVTACTVNQLNQVLCGNQIGWSTIGTGKGHDFQLVYLEEKFKTEVTSTAFPLIIYNFVKISLEELSVPVSRYTVKAGDTLAIAFDFPTPFSRTPDALSAGFAFVAGPESVGSTHRARLYDGALILSDATADSFPSTAARFISLDATLGCFERCTDLTTVRGRTFDGKVVFDILRGGFVLDTTRFSGGGSVTVSAPVSASFEETVGVARIKWVSLNGQKIYVDPSPPACSVASPTVPCAFNAVTYDSFLGNDIEHRAFYRTSSYIATVGQGTVCLTRTATAAAGDGYLYSANVGTTAWTSPPPANVPFGAVGAFASVCLSQNGAFVWKDSVPPGPAPLVTFIARGVVNRVDGNRGFLSRILPAPVTIGTAVSVEYTFNPATPDRELANTDFGRYPISTITVTVGSNVPFTRGGGEIYVRRRSLVNSMYQMDDDPNSQACTGCVYQNVEVTLDGGPFVSDALPASPPSLALFPSRGIALDFWSDDIFTVGADSIGADIRTFERK